MSCSFSRIVCFDVAVFILDVSTNKLQLQGSALFAYLLVLERAFALFLSFIHEIPTSPNFYASQISWIDEEASCLCIYSLSFSNHASSAWRSNAKRRLPTRARRSDITAWSHPLLDIRFSPCSEWAMKFGSTCGTIVCGTFATLRRPGGAINEFDLELECPSGLPKSDAALVSDRSMA
ncbi:unnamed protein product [Ixodes persulcatus]